MIEAELKRIERELGMTLPGPYVKIMLKFPDKLRQWPASEEVDRSQFFFTDLSSILDVNHRIRKQPGDFVKSPKGFVKHWPSELLIFGQCDGNWHVIDTRLKNPPMASIKGGQFDVAGAGDLKLYLDLLGMTHRDAWKEWKKGQASAKTAKSPPSISRPGDAEFKLLEHREAWAKGKRRQKAGPIATMRPADLLHEGRRLARPAVALRDRGKEYAAVWRGTGVVDAGPGKWRHWISIDAKALPDNPRKLKGVVSVYEWFADDNRIGELKIVHDPKASLPRRTDGTRLYAKPFDCLPPAEALFQFGGKPIQAWLKANSWKPRDGIGDNFPDKAAVEEYEKVLGREHPFAQGDDHTLAMLGGWSWCFSWCYSSDEGYDWSLFKKSLLLLTLAESEPWIEVFDDGKRFIAFDRIT